MVPGLDGHSTWLQPAIDALSKHFTVIACSLCGEWDSGDDGHDEEDTSGFDAQVALIDRALDEADVDRATIVGTSYGGWVALRYASRRPDRTRALVLVSAPPPGFEPSDTQQRQLQAPILSTPEFVLSAPARVLPEIVAALPTWSERVRFTAAHLSRVVRTGMSPTRMARRMRIASRIDFFEACRRVTAPTLIVTGEPGLDRIVPVQETRKYLTLIPQSEIVTLDRTGHMGSLTHADEFAEIVSSFVVRADERESRRNERSGADAEGHRAP
jgi:pimeloyl-ACP methyl ester carboxylesterase